jgi:hypothetical protein
MGMHIKRWKRSARLYNVVVGISPNCTDQFLKGAGKPKKKSFFKNRPPNFCHQPLDQ